MSTSEVPSRARVAERGALEEVVFIMGAARSGSTLLGTLIGQAPHVLFAGELTDWPGRGGRASIPRSAPFWDGIRARVPLPPTASRLKAAFDHPLGLAAPWRRGRLRADYVRVTLGVLEAAAEESGRPVVVDSSHYPRRARALRGMLGADRVRLVYMARRPSAVARSFRSTEDKNELGIQLYLFMVGALAWLVYLTHPRRSRALISYEAMVEDPIATASFALGSPMDDIDPDHLTPPPLFIGNRFARESGEIAVQKPPAFRPRPLDRATDIIQLPLALAWLAGRTKHGTRPQSPKPSRSHQLG
jgi:hypothetical protein